MVVVNYKDFLRMANKDVRIPSKFELKGKNADGVTAEQQKCLRKFGIGVTGLHYKGQASIIIGIAIDRANKHLATARQMKQMDDMGIDMLHVRTYKESKWILSGKNPDDYNITILLSYNYGDAPDKWVTIAKSRTEARKQHQVLANNDAKNIRFKVLE